MAYVYGHYKKDTNELFYIGKGSGKRAWSIKNRNSYWYKVVNKHDYYIKILYDNMTDEEAFFKERELIAEVGRENLVNMTDGGDGFTSNDSKILLQKLWETESYRVKQTKILKERWNSETYRKYMTCKAKENAQTPEYLKKVSEGVKRAIETKRDVWSECKRGNKNGRWLGSIEMYDPDGNLYKVYETAVECSKDTGIVAHNIRTKARVGESIMRGRFKGYTFKILGTGEVV
jgi:hypothetical protein